MIDWSLVQFHLMVFAAIAMSQTIILLGCRAATWHTIHRQEERNPCQQFVKA